MYLVPMVRVCCWDGAGIDAMTGVTASDEQMALLLSRHVILTGLCLLPRSYRPCRSEHPSRQVGPFTWAVHCPVPAQELGWGTFACFP